MTRLHRAATDHWALMLTILSLCGCSWCSWCEDCKVSAKTASLVVQCTLWIVS